MVFQDHQHCLNENIINVFGGLKFITNRSLEKMKRMVIIENNNHVKHY